MQKFGLSGYQPHFLLSLIYFQKFWLTGLLSSFKMFLLPRPRILSLLW